MEDTMKAAVKTLFRVQAIVDILIENKLVTPEGFRERVLKQLDETTAISDEDKAELKNQL